MQQSSPSELVYLVPFLVAIALIFVLVDNPPTRVRGKHVDFPPMGAQYVARYFRLRVIGAGVVIAALLVYGAASESFVTMMEFSAFVFMLDAMFAARSWRAGTRALALLARAGSDVSIVDDVVVITADKDTEVLPAKPWLIARARRHALPKATL
jgi:hypothetical protein